jgi:competence protein ComEC
LLTGDSQVEGLIDAFNNSSIGEISVFHVPHHGSKTGITGEIMKSLNPKIAVISVGKNKYGHPTPFTLGVLRNLKIPLLRTDQNGDIEFVSDGKSYYVAVN